VGGFEIVLPACAKPRLPKPRAAGRRSGEGRSFEIRLPAAGRDLEF